MQDARSCTHCSSRLEEGFLEDTTGEGSSKGLRWIPGPLQKGVFGGARVFGKPRYDVRAYACEGCGRVELFLA